MNPRIMEAVHAIIMFYAVYDINITHFKSTSFINDPPWSVRALIPASAILDIIVEVRSWSPLVYVLGLNNFDSRAALLTG